MFKDTNLVPDVNAFFKVHPFKRLPDKKPFTMVSCSRRNTKASILIYLNHEIKQFYIVPAGEISYYTWQNNDTHNLYFIAGVDGIFTVVHKNITKNEIKVPCCYNNPDYMATGADPDSKVIAIAEFLKSIGWEELRVYDIAPDREDILNRVKKKIEEDGWSGGRYFND